MRTIFVSQQQRVNALSARDHMWPGVSPDNVIHRFGAWLSECGTAGCFGWHCGNWAPFQAQGVTSDPVTGRVQVPGYGNVGFQLFGDSAICDARHDASDPEEMTDHEVINWRLERLIARSVVVV